MKLGKEIVNILLVEDNPGDARIIEELLREYAPGIYESVVVDRIIEVEKIAGNSKFDFILLDLNLPDSHGLETLQKIQALIVDTPIIVLTGSEDELLSAQIMQSGVQDYLRKNDITGELLLHALRYAADRFAFTQKLAESESRFRSLIEKNVDGIIVIDRQGVVRYVNPSCEKLCTRGANELLNEPFGFPVSLNEFREITFMGKAGKVHTAEMRVSEIIWEDELCFLASLRDVTERKEMEEKNKEFRIKLEQLNRDKDKFFSIIAHDLRGPFTSLLGFTEMLVEDLDDLKESDLRKITNSLRQSTSSLYGLLNNLLDWSMNQQGRFPFEPKQFVLLPEVREIVEQARESAQKKEIQISYEMDEDLILFADVKIFHTIVRNLLFNAVKFTKRGGLIKIKAQQSNNARIELSIIDNGIGMSDELVKNLFKLDKNTSRKGTDNEPSTGLGLILCKEFTDKHGGEIKVKSEVGKGSTFSIFLPSIVSRISRDFAWPKDSTTNVSTL